MFTYIMGEIIEKGINLLLFLQHSKQKLLHALLINLIND